MQDAGAGGADETFEFDVALSFAGEDRGYVHPIAETLRDNGINVFYDDFHKADRWGADLPVFFDDIFRKKARYAILFISKYYVEKLWPRYERQSAQARALVQESPYVLPVRLDDSELPGLRPTIGYVDARVEGRDGLIEIIFEKLAAHRPVERVPRTLEEEAILLAGRPDGWEYLLFASELLRGRDELEPMWHDHQVGYSASQGSISDAEARELIGGAFGESRAIVANVGRVLSKDSLDRAFGLPGEPGEPALIKHAAQRLIDVYGALLEWSSRLRGFAVSEDYENLLEIVALFVDQPIRQVRDFVDLVVTETDRIPSMLRAGEPINLTLTLTVALEDGIEERFYSELTRLERRASIDQG